MDGGARPGYSFGPFHLDPAEHVLYRAGQPVPLTPKAIDTLLVLLEHRGRVVTKADLMKTVWPDTAVEDNNLTQNISALRKVLGDDRVIETVPRRGYRFTGAVREQWEEPVDLLLHRRNGWQVVKDVDETTRTRRRTRLMWTTAVLATATAAALWVRLSGRTTAPSISHVTIVPFTSFPGDESMPAFSPDGRQIAFVWDGSDGNNADIYVKLVDAGTPLRLTTDANSDHSPAWSPDGRSIAFIRSIGQEAEIRVVPALGGAERKLHSQPWVLPALSWSPDGKLLAFAHRSSPRGPHSIAVLTVDRAEPRQLTFPPAGYPGDWTPSFSPDGQTVAFVRASPQGHDVYRVPLSGGEPRRVTRETRPSIKGLDWTQDGARLVFSSGSIGNETLWMVSAGGGAPERITVGGENAIWPSVSRQGQRLAYVQELGNMDIWRVKVPNAGGGDSPTRLIASSRHDAAPQFSPDGKKIAFRSDRSGNSEIWVCASAGSNPVQLTAFGGPHTGTPRWSPDGRHVAFDSRPEGHSDVFVVSVDGGPTRRLTMEPSEDGVASWSRDGTWIYFGSDRSGAWQVWKVPAAGGRALQVTKHGGFAAFESTDGALLYYAKFRQPGLWKIPVAGGEETMVLDRLNGDLWGYWAINQEGVFFLRPETQPDRTVKSFIDFFNLTTRRVTRVAALEKGPDPWGPGLSVSPDGQWIVYNQVDRQGRDIILMDNFR